MWHKARGMSYTVRIQLTNLNYKPLHLAKCQTHTHTNIYI